jgi:carbohydrate-selective porin OprB
MAEVNSRDQYTFEAYYRLQVLAQLQIVPSVQLILDPADNPSIDSLWVPSLRVRAVF